MKNHRPPSPATAHRQPRLGEGPGSAALATALTLVLTLTLTLALAACTRAGPTAEPLAPSPAASAAAGPAGGETERVDLGRAGLSRPITFTVADAMLSGRAGTEGERFDVWRVDPDGALRGEPAGQVEAGPGEGWQLPLEDAAGAALHPLAGEGLLLRPVDAASGVRDELAVLPALDLDFDRAGGRIRGRVDPALVGEVAVEVAPAESAAPFSAPPAGVAPPTPPPAGPPQRLEAPVAADGRFELVAEGPLRGGAALTVTGRTRQGLALVAPRQVPWVRVSLHPGDVLGGGAPLAPVTLTLRAADGRLRGIGRARAGARGDFRAWIRDADGERLRPAPGDRLTVDAGDAPWELTIAPLSGLADAAAGTLSGQGEPGAALDLTVWNPWRPGEYAMPRTTVAADGRWSQAIDVPIEAASHYYLNQHLATGDLIFYCQQLPRLHLSPGSPRVRVEGLTDLEAALTLSRGGRVLARAAGVEPWSGTLALDFVDTAGQALALEAGDHLVGTVSGSPIDLVVPAFEAEMDTAGQSLVGRTEPGWTVTLAAPSPLPESARQAGADGRFQLPLPADSRAAEALAPGGEVTAYTVPPGQAHNVGRRFLGPRLTVDLDTGEVAGEALPGAGVAWSDGGPAAAAVAVTGGLRAALPAGSGPGRSLTLRVGQVPVGLTLPDLGLAFDPATGLASGTAPPGETLELRVYEGRESPGDAISVSAGEDGRWALDLGGAPGQGHRYDPAAVRRLELLWRAGPGLVYRRAWTRPG